MIPPTLYLAAAYPRRDEIRECAEALKADGFKINSSWVYETEPLDIQLTDLTPGQNCELAVRCWNEIRYSDAFVCFTEPPRPKGQLLTGRYRGGRHVELGLAIGILALHRVAVVGPSETVFHHVAPHHYDDFESFRRNPPKGWLRAGTPRGAIPPIGRGL